MKYLIAAPELTKPTFETLTEQVKIRFQKIDRLVNNLKVPNVTVKISVRKEGKTFHLILEAKLDFANKELVVKEKGADIRRLVSLASQTLKNEILRLKEITKNTKRDSSHKQILLNGS